MQLRKRHRPAHGLKRGRQVQAAHVERQFRAQHLEKRQYVIHGLGQGVGDPVDAAVSHLRHGFRASLVTVGQAKRVRRRRAAEHPLQESMTALIGAAQDEVRTFVAGPKPGAHQDALPELQFVQVALHARQVRIRNLGPQHRKQLAQAPRAALPHVRIRHGSHFSQAVDEHLHDVDGSMQDGGRMLAREGPIASLPGLDRFRGEGIQLADRVGKRQAIAQDVLAIQDGLCVVAQAKQHRLVRDRQDEIVLAGHGLEEDAQFKVLAQDGFVSRQRAGGIEVRRRMHQESLHGVIRLSSQSYVTRNFSAMAKA
jgi:hypothetical protein